MPLLPYTMASRAGKRLLAGGRSGGAAGAGVGAVAGGLHGAVTDDPNNPHEGRMGRILSGALGGAAMGAGVGGAYGAGKAHVGNLTRAATNTGRMQGFAGGLAAGAAARPAVDAVKSTVQNFTKGFADRGAQQVAKQTAVEKSIARHQRNMARKPAPASAQAAPAGIKPSKNPYKQDPYYDKNSEFYGGATPSPQAPTVMSTVKGKIQDIKQNRAASQAAEQDAKNFADQGQWKVSSPGFWSGFSNRAHGVF